MESSLLSVWLQLELCAMAALLTQGDIRCYCDAPPCVSTGYMCKSQLNACFTSVLEPRSPHSPLTHGCLDPDAAGVCSSSRRAADTAPTVECCHDDMCNYRGLQELAPSRAPPDGRPAPDNRNLVTRVQELASSREVWFRAAVISVPIAGGLVLLLLVLLALRMLRSENQRLQERRQQMLSRLHYSFHGRHEAKLDLECMVPVTGQENCCPLRRADPGGDRVLSLVHWSTYSGHV